VEDVDAMPARARPSAGFDEDAGEFAAGGAFDDIVGPAEAMRGAWGGRRASTVAAAATPQARRGGRGNEPSHRGRSGGEAQVVALGPDAPRRHAGGLAVGEDGQAGLAGGEDAGGVLG